MKISSRPLATARHAVQSALFKGEVLLAPPTPLSERFVTRIITLIQEVMGLEDIRSAHTALDDETFFAAISRLRRIIYLEKEFHDRTFEMLAACGFNRTRLAFDPFRLRVVTPGGHRNARAAPVYFPHRDTWYSHPQSVIVLWIPLHDLREEETFVFYPDYFTKPVPNDSEIFNYNDWVRDGPELKIGWQKKDSGINAGYPRSAASFDAGEAAGFSAKAGEQLFFSGAQFHRTLPQDTAQTRYSLDVRFVDLDDVNKGFGAPNADNRSKGSSLNDYIRYDL